MNLRDLLIRPKQDIHSLTDFQRNTKAHLERLTRTGRPEALTINGRAELVVFDVDTYEKVLDYIDRLEALEGIRRGLMEAKQGKEIPLEQFREEMRARYGIGESK